MAETAASLSFMIHSEIGGANGPGGWYRGLKDAVGRDIERLGSDRVRRRRPGAWRTQDWWITVADFLALLFAGVGFVGLAWAGVDALA